MLGLIATAFALTCIALAWKESGLYGKIFLGLAVVLSFVLPYVFPSYVMSASCTIGRMVLGVGCFLYVKYHGYF